MAFLALWLLRGRMRCSLFHRTSFILWHTFKLNYENLIKMFFKTRNTKKIVYSECMLRLGVLRVLCCSVYLFCTSHFVMVPLNLTYLHCLQHSFFEHLVKKIFQRFSFSETTSPDSFL